MTYDQIERDGDCTVCGASQYRTGEFVGCSNPNCERYASRTEHWAAAEGDGCSAEGGVIESPTWPDGCRMTVNELPNGATYRGHIDCRRVA